MAKQLSRIKILHFFIAFFCFLLIEQNLFAQHSRKSVRDSLFDKYSLESSQEFMETKPYYILEWQSTLPENVRIVRQFDAQMAIVEVKDRKNFESLKQQAKITKASDQWKFSPSTEQQIDKIGKEAKFILSSLNIDSLLPLINTLTDHLKIIRVDRPSHSILVKTTSKFLKERLLPLKEIIFIDVRAEPQTEVAIIGYNRSFHGLNAVDYSIPGAYGKNIVAGVKEQKMEETDLDLYKRVLNSTISSANTTNHATVISSIIGGSGNRFYDGRGIAYGCKFFPSSFDNLFADDAVILNTNKVTVQNHSYGTTIQQFYGAEAVSYDAHAWQNKNFIHVFSAGNRGTASATEGPYTNIPTYANLTGNFKMAKNIITVGAIDNKGNIPAESSAGPLYDGRLAPQLIALGPNGTSDAAALVAGTTAVMQQVYADSNSQSLPAASLIKAVLYNTADDIHSIGIDYKTGYGLLNSFSAIKSVQHKEYDWSTLQNGQSWTKNFLVPANAAQLKVTLAWADTASLVNNNKALINDLDLEVIELNTGIIYKPWVLNTTAHSDSLKKTPTRKRDSLNTAEQVSIKLPAGGNYQIKVIGASLNTVSLPFHIAFHIDTLNTFSFTSPQHASDINRAEDENLMIRWKTFVSDTNQTGNLFITYNNGGDWQLLKPSHKIYTNQFQWFIKDTNSRAQLKMETSFGDFLSKEFIISKVIRPVVDYLCIDSFQLSWNKHIYANAYKIYALTDSAYLKEILTVNDTFTVIKRSLYSWLVYAVEPVLSNNLAASRSVAFDITLQGTKCFYKTIYYNLQSDNKLELILELSSPGHTDSVFFEHVTVNGQLLQTYGGLKVNGSSIYNQLINDIPAGTSYWRARIKLKNGSIVFTEIISVLTTGKKYILFYPNPVDRNSSLMFLLQQNLPTDCKLQLFDITGRMMKSYSEIPNSIQMQNFAPGVLIYRLSKNDNQLLEIGKLVIK